MFFYPIESLSQNSTTNKFIGNRFSKYLSNFFNKILNRIEI